MSFKNENSSIENFELVPSISENSTNENSFKPTTIFPTNTSQLTVQRSSLTIRDDSTKSLHLIAERKSSKSDQDIEKTNTVQNLILTGENFSFKSSSDFLNDDNKTGSNKSKQTTPPSECYYYLVKPNFISTTSKKETFEISALQSPSQNKINFEPVEDQSEDNLKTFLENCLDQLSKNKKNECSNSAILEDSSITTNISNNIESPISSLTNNTNFNNQIKSNNQLLMENSSLVLSDATRLSLVRKQKTIVEKIPDSNNESSPLSTNTFLLNGENLNDLNDFYSLKITFV